MPGRMMERAMTIVRGAQSGLEIIPVKAGENLQLITIAGQSCPGRDATERAMTDSDDSALALALALALARLETAWWQGNDGHCRSSKWNRLTEQDISTFGREALLAIDDLSRRTIDLRVKMRNLQHAAACLRCKQGRHDAGSREIEWTMIRGERLLAAVSAAEDKLTQTRDTLATQLSLFEK
jgi:hypothetical protein